MSSIPPPSLLNTRLFAVHDVGIVTFCVHVQELIAIRDCCLQVLEVLCIAQRVQR